MKPPQVKAAAKNQQIAQAKIEGFLMGVKCGAVVTREMIKCGWTDLDRLPSEAVRRVTGK